MPFNKSGEREKYIKRGREKEEIKYTKTLNIFVLNGGVRGERGHLFID